MSKTRARILNSLRKVVNKLVNLHVSGSEYIPPEGAFLVCTNHISRLDTPFLMAATQRNDIIGMVARQYQKSPIIGWILTRINVIWITRGTSDTKAFREASQYLHNGGIVGIAPEGRRSKTQELLEGKPGAALLALKNNVLIIPAAVTGSTEMFKYFLQLKKMEVHLSFGAPFRIPDRENFEDNKSLLKAATDEIMCHIAILLPEARRGFYADHPRVKELLEQTPPPGATSQLAEGGTK